MLVADNLHPRNPLVLRVLRDQQAFLMVKNAAVADTSRAVDRNVSAVDNLHPHNPLVLQVTRQIRVDDIGS